MSGTLFIVPTPIGNLADISPRAVEVLNSVSVILAEDTRTSGVLLKHIGVTTPMLSHHKYNEHSAVQRIIERLEGGEDIALISDAGTPGISDPGFLLSAACRDADIKVITLPGPSALIPALVNSGLSCERFTFQGFLPLKKGRATRLEEIASSPVTNVFYESPVRLVKTLTQLRDICGGDRQISVSREISKVYEETVRGTIDSVIARFTSNAPRGEFVVCVAGAPVAERKQHKNKYKPDDSSN